MSDMLNRRNFIKGGMLATGAVAGGGCASLSQGSSSGGRFYKGQFHTHTWWSDGRAAPEQAVAFYKDRGYDFLGLTDHNVYARGVRSRKLKKDNVNDM
ncbi:MAG: twin-arginine translocation signal domain-containing protein, partial [Kiritimatiellae bacterium]|nr:twin-arginine translocation signal domain-containing protein [Kiritimatiellia bacterium]